MSDVNAKFTINQPKYNVKMKINTYPTDYINSIAEGSGNLEVIRTGKEVIINNFTFIHEQGVASDVWTINHNLNKYPTVVTVDSAGTQFYALVHYDDMNNCTVYMNGKCKGKAYLN